MKVTIFIGGLSKGGAERVVSNLANYLSKNHSVTILTMSDDNPSYHLEKKVKRESLINKNERKNKLLDNLLRVYRLRKYIVNSGSDIYVVFLPGTINLLLSQRKLIKVPIIISERGDPSVIYEKSKIQRFFMNKIYKHADNYVFQTKGAMEFYEKFIGKRGEIIPNAINDDFLKPDFSGTRRKVIVSAGRFTEQKNFKLLIDSFSIIENDFPDYTLEIYGDGPLFTSLQNYVSQIGLSHKVQFPGYVKDIGTKIQDASLFVLSSDYEGMPNSLMEALVLGVPSISTDCPVGGPKFLIDDGKNGFLVPVGDKIQLSKKMKCLLLDDSLSQQFTNESKKISETLSSETIYAKWENIIIETVK